MDYETLKICIHWGNLCVDYGTLRLCLWTMEPERLWSIEPLGCVCGLWNLKVYVCEL